MVDSCQHCAACDKGLEQYCAQFPTLTYNGVDRHDKTPTFGGYSESIVAREKFVLKLPQGLGLGGLGHMALKLAKALGAEVTLLTRSPGKEADARRLGADRIVLSTNAEQMAAVTGRFDLIIDTVPYAHDLNPYLPTLAVDGTLVLVGYLGALDPALNTSAMVLQRKSVAGSLIGGIAETQELLDFCGEHGITSDIESIRIQDINTAYERMLKSDVKYRFVIDMGSLGAAVG